MANICGFLCLVHFIFQSSFNWSTVINEFHVLELVFISSIDLNDCLNFKVRHCEAKVGKGLSELLWGHLEVFVTIPILEEALRVKSVSLEPLFEALNDTLS